MTTSTQIPGELGALLKEALEHQKLSDRGAFKIKEAAIYLGVSVVQVRRYRV